jgi:hypothetical protein
MATCPDCKGRKRIVLLLSEVDCTVCGATGEVSGEGAALQRAAGQIGKRKAVHGTSTPSTAASPGFSRYCSSLSCPGCGQVQGILHHTGCSYDQQGRRTGALTVVPRLYLPPIPRDQHDAIRMGFKMRAGIPVNGNSIIITASAVDDGTVRTVGVLSGAVANAPTGPGPHFWYWRDQKLGVTYLKAKELL